MLHTKKERSEEGLEVKCLEGRGGHQEGCKKMEIEA